MKEKTGYSHEYILWGVPWTLLLMEAADAPRYVKGNPDVPVVDNADELMKILGHRAKKIDNA